MTASMTERFSLKGRVVLITSAATGLGQHFAEVLASAGARVAVAARRADKLAATVEHIRASGGEAVALTLDVTQSSSVKACLDALNAEWGAPDVVINNAGVTVTRSLLEQTEEDWDQIMATNLKGAWLVASEAARRLLAAGKSGAIVNIASVLGMATSRGHGIYSATKAGVIQLTRHMALELAGKGIRVNAICPGYFKTEMNDAYFDSAAGQQYIAATPGGRLGRMEEMDGPLLLLASDAGSFINGALLPVDGGHLVMSI